jgi:periplasmic protein TonB
MFEDSLVESAGRVRTRSHRYVAGSFALEAALLACLVVFPYICPDALPRNFRAVPLMTPPHAAPQMTQERSASSPIQHPEMLTDTLTAPPRIPTGIRRSIDAAPPELVVGGDLAASAGSGPPGVPFGGSPTPRPRVELAKPTGPIRVSAGVATGQLVVPIRPVYPPIALASRTQGTVLVEAVISKEGTVENLRVVSGPPLLVNAATAAIRQARYRPWMLNGSPVEVETTISVVFRLDGQS